MLDRRITFVSSTLIAFFVVVGFGQITYALLALLPLCLFAAVRRCMDMRNGIVQTTYISMENSERVDQSVNTPTSRGYVLLLADALLLSGLIGVPAGEIRLAFATAAGVLIHGAISGMNAQ